MDEKFRKISKLNKRVMENNLIDSAWRQAKMNLLTKRISGVTQCTRTAEQIRRMYANVKQRAKEKDGDRKKTGGGPNLKLTQCEDMVLEGIKDKPQLGGIIGGLDSSSTESSKAIRAKQSFTDTTHDLTESAATTSTCTSGVAEKDDVNVSGCSLRTSMANKEINKESYPVSSGKGKKRKMVVDQLYELEVKRAQAEISLLEQRKEQEAALFEIKRDMLKASMEQEKKLFELKGKVLQENLNKALEQNLLLWNEN